MQETRVRSLGQEDPLEKGMATHSSILALETPQMEEPGVLQSLGWQRDGYDRGTNVTDANTLWAWDSARQVTGIKA